MAKVYLLAAAALIGVFRFFSNDAQVGVLIFGAATTLLLLVGGIIQVFTVDKPKAFLNLAMGIFGLILLAVLAPVLSR